MGRAARRGAAALARVPADLARARTRSGGWRRSSRWRWPTRPRRRPACPPARSGSSGRTTSSSRAPDGAGVRKLAGVLGETDGLGTDDPRVVVGIGVNADWAAADFPPDLAGVDDVAARGVAAAGRSTATPLLDAFLGRLEVRHRGAARRPRSTSADWTDRQLTTGRTVRLERPDGAETVRALGVDPATGALVVADAGAPGGERHVARRRDRPRPRSPTPRSRRRCNAMARPAFRKVDRPEEGGPRLAHLDRDRRLVEAAQADPARFDALYRKYLAQVYSYAFYELARPSRGRGRHRADVPRRPGQPRPVRGARPAGRRRGRLDVPRLALPDRPQRRRRAAPAASAAARRRRSRPPRTSPTRSTSRPTPALRDEAAAAWRAVGPPARRPPPGAVLRFVDEMSTAEIAGVLGRSEGAVRVLIHRAPAQRRARPRRRGVGDRRVRRTRRPRGRGARHRPLPRRAPRRPRPRRRPRARPRRPRPDAIRRAADRLARGPAALPPVVPVRGGASPPGWPRRPPGCACATRGRRRGPRRARSRGAATSALDDLDRGRRRPTIARGYGRPLLIGGALTSAALSLAGAAYVAWRLNRPDGQPDGARRARRRPGRGSPDADQAAVVPRPPRRLPARPVDEVPVVRDDAVQQAARQGLRVCPTCGHHFRLSAAARLELLLDHGTFGGARRRASSRSTRSASSTRSPTRTGSPPPSSRPGCATPPSGAPATIDGRPRRDLRHGLRVHGRLDGRGRRREGHPRRRARPRRRASR